MFLHRDRRLLSTVKQRLFKALDGLRGNLRDDIPPIDVCVLEPRYYYSATIVPVEFLDAVSMESTVQIEPQLEALLNECLALENLSSSNAAPAPKATDRDGDSSTQSSALDQSETEDLNPFDTACELAYQETILAATSTAPASESLETYTELQSLCSSVIELANVVENAVACSTPQNDCRLETTPENFDPYLQSLDPQHFWNRIEFSLANVGAHSESDQNTALQLEEESFGNQQSNEQLVSGSSEQENAESFFDDEQLHPRLSSSGAEPIHLVFIDTGIIECESIVEDFSGPLADRRFRIELIDPAHDGLQQINAVLSELHTPVESIHILGHSNGRSIKLGSSWLNHEALEARQDELAIWANSLTPDGDVLLYNCDARASESGQSLLQRFALKTGSDVAAVSEIANSVELDCDWLLECHIGTAESDIIVGSFFQVTWQSLVTSIAETSVQWTEVGDLHEIVSDALGIVEHELELGGYVQYDTISASQLAISTMEPAPQTLPNQTTENAELSSAEQAIISDTATELLFIDSRVANFEQFLHGITGGDELNRRYEIVLLDEFRDGIEQITEVLTNRQNIQAVHILSHGNEHAVQLGATWLDNDAVSNYSDQIASWGWALSSDADLLFYGCRLAENTEGQSLLMRIQELTGSDVAASSDNTGHESLGADWELEYRTGSIETALAISSLAQQEWIGILATASFREGVSGYFGSQDTSLSSANPNTNYGADQFVYVQSSGPTRQMLIQFDNIFGSGAGQIPVGSTINSASLSIYPSSFHAGTLSLHRMLATWSESSTWNSMVNGVQTDGVEAATAVDSTASSSANPATFSGLASALQDWANGSNNYGWVIIGTNATGWPGYTSERSTISARPILSVDYTAPSPGINVSPVSGLSVSETGTTASFTVVLNSQPTNDVVIGISSSDLSEGTVSTPTLTFTSSDWNSPKSVTVTGVDDMLDDGNVSFNIITAAATSSDSNYHGLNASDVSVQNADNDSLNTVVVDTTSDTVDGTTTSLDSLIANKGADGKISLREAITAANNTVNGVGGPDRINFDFLGAGPHTITLTSAFPVITDAVFLDGWSEPNFSNVPIIELDGTSAGAGANGLAISGAGAAGSTIRGFVINRFADYGIYVQSANTTITGNYVGTNAAGDAAAGNNTDSGLGGGIVLFTNGNTLGGTGTNDRNVVSGNTIGGARGIELWNSDNNTIINNYVGTNATGTAAIANSGSGIALDGDAGNGSDNNIIGGVNSAERNLLSGNSSTGVFIDNNSDGNRVWGNYIGTDASGSGAIANSVAGVLIDSSSSDNVIGGTELGAGNLIAFNLQDGVALSASAGNGNRILRNRIHSNGGLGIDLADDGVTNNDAVPDADTGANRLQNYPVLTGAFTNEAGTISIIGVINSSSWTTFRLEFFSNATGDQGQTYLGYREVTTNGGGSVSFIESFSANVPVGFNITATATNLTTGDTSEFSATHVTSAALPVDTFSDVRDGDTSSVSNLLMNMGVDGKVSLREAIIAINNGATHQGIYLGAGTYQMSLVGTGEDDGFLGDLDIRSSVTIFGAGAAATTIDGGGLDRVFDLALSGSSLFLNGVTVAGGQSDFGAGIHVSAGATLTVANSVIQNNVSVGTSDGGGIYVAGTAWIDSVRITGNQVLGNGGAIASSNTAELHIANSLIDGNTAALDGGGIHSAGLTTIVNTTISGNSANDQGGGVANTGTLSLLNVTITDNTANSGGGSYSFGTGTIHIRNSIVASNFATGPDDDVSGTHNSLGHNIIGNTTGSTGWVGSDQQNVNPLLNALGDNGGFTYTHSLQALSPAIDAGSTTNAPVNDQRGESRNDGTTDIGAFEFNSSSNIEPAIANLDGDALTYFEGSGAVLIDQGADATVTDVDSPDFDTGTLTVSISAGGVAAQDVLSVRNQGSGVGQISVIGYGLAYSGTLIGSFTGGANGSPLVITLNSNATHAAVSALLRNITYRNVSETTPTPGARTVRFVLNDGDYGTSSTYSTTVTVSPVNDSPTFSIGDGIATVAIGSGEDVSFAVALQSDGKIVSAGYSFNGTNYDFAITRRNASGSLDTSFNGTGIVTTSLGSGNDVIHDVLILADGKILVTGVSHNGTNDDFAVARYNSDGSLDTTFNGSGFVTTAIGTGQDWGNNVAVQADGKVLMSGFAVNGASRDLALVRYNVNGTLDTSFNGSGIVTTSIGAGDDHGVDLVIQSDGKILVAGSSSDGVNHDFALVRYNSDGSLDTSFNVTGMVVTSIGTGHDFGYAIALQSDGKIIVSGDSHDGTNQELAVVRYNTDGSLDASFNGTGKATTSVGSGDDWNGGLVLQADGKILVSGFSHNGSNFDMSLVRFTTEGSLDTTFAGTGKLTTSAGTTHDEAYGVIVQPDGKIVLTGSSNLGSNMDFVTLRYNSDGSLDTQFDNAPTNSLGGNVSFTENGPVVVLDANVEVFDAELSSLDNFNTSTLSLVRNGGANTHDAFSATGTLNPLTEGGSLVVAGVTIGTVTTNSNGLLLLTFNNNATNARVNAALRQIAYSFSGDNPPGSVQIDWSFNDSNAGAQGGGGALFVNGSVTVNITSVADHVMVVDTTSDSADGDTSNIDTLLDNRGVDGRISLREALIAANNTPGLDTIHFDIPTNDSKYNMGQLGVFAIQLKSALPTITEAVVIDATTQSQYINSPVIEIDGASAGANANGFNITGGGSTVKGFAINGFASGSGIRSATGGGNDIAANYIGLRATGEDAVEGAVGWWKGENTTSDSLLGLNGTVAGGVTYAGGRVGDALNFDGSGYVVVTDNNRLDMTSAVTMESWVYFDSLSNPYNVIVSKEGTGRNYLMSVSSSGELIVSYFNAVAANVQLTTATGVVSTGQWYHMVGIIDTVTGTIQAYLNGSLAASTAASGSMVANTDTLIIGAAGGGFSSRMTGKIDELALYNRALNASEIAANYNAGLVGQSPARISLVTSLRFENSASDDRGLNHGTTIGSPTYTSGKIGQAIDFSGGEGIVIANPDSFSTRQLTYAVWFNTTQLSSPMLAGRHFADGKGWQLDLNSQGEIHYRIDTDIATGQSSNLARLAADGRWHLAIFTLDTVTRTVGLSLDGSSVVTSNYVGDFVNPVSGSFQLAKDLGWSTDFSGKLDEFQVFNRVLTNSEIAGLYVNQSRDTNTFAIVPVSSYKMEGDASDFTSTNEGTLMGSPAAVPGIAGQGLQLDGVDDYVQIANHAALNPSQISVAGWWYGTDFVGSGSDALISKGYTSHTNPFYQYHLGIIGNQHGTNPGTYSFSASIGGVVHAVTSVGHDTYNANQWNFFVGTYDGNALKLYSNGVLINQNAAPSGPLDSYATDLFIGKIGNGPWFLPGTVDEVSIYARALSDSEIADMYNAVNQSDASNSIGVTLDTSAGNEVGGGTPAERNVISGNLNYGVHVVGNGIPEDTVSWWKFDGNANDFVGTNNGTLNGASIVAGGVSGSSLNLDGVNDYMSVSNESNFDFAEQQFTVETWFKTTTTGVLQGLVTKGNTGDYQWNLQIHTSNKIYAEMWNAAGTAVMTAASNTTVTDGQWHHVVAIFDTRVASELVTVYLDGVLQTDTPVDNRTTANYHTGGSNSVTIGGRIDGFGYFDGHIDDTAIYARGLTADEVTAIYRSGGGVKGGNVIQGNYIGTNTTGTQALGNRYGIYLSNSAGNLIGGDVAGQGNLISGNSVTGIVGITTNESVGVTRGNVIRGNLIGTDVSSSGSLGAQLHGIDLDEAPSNIVGGAGAGARNIISGHTYNSLILQGRLTVNNIVHGNYIGTNLLGTTSVANGLGISIYDGATNNIIGGGPGAGNVISGNSGAGVNLQNAGITTRALGTWRGEANADDGVLGNHGTWAGSAGYASGVRGLAFNFDGSSYVTLPNEATYDFVEQVFTVEGWFKTNAAGTQRIVGKGTTGNQQWCVTVGPTNNLSVAFFNSAGAVVYEKNSTASVTDGQWHHFAAVFDTQLTSEDVQLYLDGVEQTNSTTDTRATNNYNATGSAPLVIGAQADGNSPFTGQVDELNVVTRALTGEEIRQQFLTSSSSKLGNSILGNLIGRNAANTADIGNTGNGIQLLNASNTLIGGSGPSDGNTIRGNGGDGISVTGTGELNGYVAYWKADGSPNESSGAYSSSWIGTPAYGASALGASSGAFSFDGSNYVSVADTSSLRPDPLTVDAWFYATQFDGFDTIVAKGVDGSTSNASYQLGLASGVPVFLTTHTLSGVSVSQATSAVTLNEWHHIVGTFDGATRNLYVDGQLVDSDVVSDALAFGVGVPLTIGEDIDFGAPAGTKFNGLIEEVAIYNRALAAEEVAGIYTLRGKGQVVPSQNNAFLRNSIANNGQLGIDLYLDGVTANDDAPDNDGPPNGLQNFPILTSSVTSGGNTTIVGTLSSAANTNYRIEFFSSPTGDPSGSGEGQTYLGSTTVTTNGAGTATINATLIGVSVTAGHTVTTTATVDLGGGAYGNTSEFSANVSAAYIPPGISVSAISGNTTESNGTATFTIVLDSQPTDDVTIAISSSDTTEGTASVSSVVFTAVTWSTSQTVTVTGVDDLVDDGNVVYSIITTAATSNDLNYSGLNASDVVITNLDDADTAGISVGVTGPVTNLGGETRVNSTTTGTQSTESVANQAVASDASGNYIVVWTSNGQDGDGWGVFGQRFNANGVALGSEFQVNTTTANDQQYASVGMSADGRFVVSWQTQGGASGIDTALRFYNADGTAATGEVLAKVDNSDAQFSPTVAVSRDGRVLATWNDYNIGGDSQGIGGRLFDISGTPIGSEFLINQTTAGAQSFSHAAFDDRNNFVVTWVDASQDGSGSGVYGRQFSANGTALGGEFRANTTIANDQYYNRVAVAPDGSFTIAWASNLQDGSGHGIYAQRYHATGTTLGSEFQVHHTAYMQGDQIAPYVAVDRVGNLNFIWESENIDGDGKSVVMRRYNFDGNAVTTSDRVSSTTLGNQQFSSMALLKTGEMVVVWSGNGVGDSDGVFMQRLATMTNEANWSEPTFAVRLDSQPVSNVTINLSSSDPSEGNIATSSLIFTSGNWNTPQTVAINNANDAIVDGDINYSIITAAATSGDLSYDSLDAPDGHLITIDNDVAEMYVRPKTLLAETQVNGAAAGDNFNSYQDQRSIAVDASGNYVVAWTRNNGVTRDVFARLYDSNDTPLGAEFQISTTSADHQAWPSVARNASGQFVIVWDSNNQDGSGWGVYARAFNANGTAATGEIQVNATTASTQRYAAVKMDASGNFVVGWDSYNQDGSEYGSFLRKFAFNGAALSGEVQVNQTTAGRQEFTTLGTDALGNVVVVWQSNNQDGSLGGIYGRKYDASLNPLGNEFQVNQTSIGQQINPSIAVAPNGDFVVAWVADDINSVGQDVYARRYNAAGLAQGNEFVVNTRRNGWQYNATVEIDSAGRFLVAFHADYQDGQGAGGYAQLYLADGTPLGGNWRVSDDPLFDQYAANIIFAPNGQLLSVFTDWNSTSSNISFKRFANPFVSTTENGATSQWEVLLSSEPTHDVTIDLTSSDTTEATLSAASLVFTSANWNTPQAVTITGVDDVSADANVNYVFGIAATTSNDANFDGIDPVDISLLNLDNEIVVDTASDSADGDTSSIFALYQNKGADGRISLREAITAANNTANGASGPDRILFAIPEGDVGYINPNSIPGDGDEYWSIKPISSLPTIASAMEINGMTQTGAVANTAAYPAAFNGRLTVEISGELLPSATYLMMINGGGAGSQIRGLVMNRADGNGTYGPDGIAIRLEGTNNVLIAGNYLGSNITGMSDFGAGNTEMNIYGNNSWNITIGGTAAADRNLISAGVVHGMYLKRGGSYTILGNYIGADAGGGTSLSAQGFGIDTDRVAGITIGSGASGAGNLFADHFYFGTSLAGSYTSSAVVRGNEYRANGLGGYAGIGIADSVSGVTIGGANVGEGNVFYANSTAMTIGGSGGHVIVGNTIGDPGGNPLLANTNGISLYGVTTNGAITIGGTGAGQGNVIVNNNGYGIAVSNSGTVKRILGNSIYGNAGLGIDLGNDGVTANDLGDGDIGVNGLQNFPLLFGATTNGSTVSVVGSLNSQAGVTYRVEFFASGSADGSGHGEGERFLGYQDVTTDAMGNADISAVLSAAVAVGEHISATATNLSAGTSEFSHVVMANAAGISVSGSTGATSEDGADATFTIVLDSQPTHDVTVVLSSLDPTEGIPGVGFVVFTTANWNTPQIVTIQGVDDALLDGNTSYSIVTAPAVSSDPNYGGQNAADVVLQNLDNESAPVIDIDNANDAVLENSNNGDYAGITARAVDPDPGDSMTYSLDDNAGGRFQINAISGEVTVASGSLIDYEVSSSHSITIRATSTDGSFSTSLWVITVNNVNEAPTAIPNLYWTTYINDLTISQPGVLWNDSDPEYNPLTARLTTDTTFGTLSLQADGSFVYRPLVGFVGWDWFEYVANDGQFDSSLTVVQIQVGQPDSLPGDNLSGGDYGNGGGTGYRPAPEDAGANDGGPDSLDQPDLTSAIAGNLIQVDHRAILVNEISSQSNRWYNQPSVDGTWEDSHQTRLKRFDAITSLIDSKSWHIDTWAHLSESRIGDSESKVSRSNIDSFRSLRRTFQQLDFFAEKQHLLLDETNPERVDFSFQNPIVRTVFSTGVILWAMRIGQIATALAAVTVSFACIDPLTLLQYRESNDEPAHGLGTAERLFSTYKKRREKVD